MTSDTDTKFKPSIARPLPMPEGVTEEMEEAYLDSYGEACLFCQADEVKYDKDEAGNPAVAYYKNEAVLVAECKACGKRWQDVYILTRVEEADE